MDAVGKSLVAMKETIEALGESSKPTLRVTLGLSPEFGFDVPAALKPFLNRHLG